jgi:hypothetical protein
MVKSAPASIAVFPLPPPPLPATRSTQIQAITIDSNSNTVNGALLTLEFRKSFSARPYYHWSTTSRLLHRTFRHLQLTSGLVCKGIGRIRRRTVWEPEVIRYCTSKLPCKMECRFLPPFHRYLQEILAVIFARCCEVTVANEHC